MNPTASTVKKEVKKVLPDIISIRQHLHGNPELSLKEFNTSSYIREKLKGLGLNILEPFISTDVVALLNDKKTGRNITLRADIDALPLNENTGLPYCSINDNIMHACGHDGHTAILIGAAMVLSKFKESLNGSVRFIFQPAEEIVSGGRELIFNGALKEPEPAAVLSIHAWPGYPEGSICSRPGPIMAAADFFVITIKGKGGHGSAPEKTIDPIYTSSKVLNGLYLIPSRKLSALDSAVISICSIKGGTNGNIIPNDVVIKGSVRYYDEKVGREIPRLFEQVVKSECSCTGAEYDLYYKKSCIPTVNDHAIVETCRDVVLSESDNISWINIDVPVMGSEDFSYYIDKYPGAMFFLGLGEDSPALHTDTFDFNDSAMEQGILFFVLSTLKLISDENI